MTLKFNKIIKVVRAKFYQVERFMSYRVDRKTKTNSDDAKNNAVLVTVDSN